MITELGIADGPAPEVRADATDLYIDALIGAVGATTVQTWAAGAVEIAAGLWSRALSTAAVEGAPVGPRLLSEIGRDLARHGEAVYLLDIAAGGRLRLLRCDTRDTWGEGPDPADWWYRLTVTGPRSHRTVTAPAASVVHLRYATEAHSPARGVSPLQYASLTGQLGANLEQSLGYEAGGAVANLIALPEGHQSPAGLTDAIRTAKGRTLLPETVAGGYGDSAAAPRKDFVPSRLGADPPTALVHLRQHVESSVLSCFGVGAPLGPAGLNDGTAAREAARRLWTLTIQPLAAVIGEELSRVFEVPVSLNYGRPSGMADLAARARAVGALVKAGVEQSDALLLTGWTDD